MLHRPCGARPRVLYAEDQTEARIVTAALLKRMGCDVVAVEHGEAAVEKARAGSYDVILLDIEMPVMDGVTAARQIRKLAGTGRRPPILALSAFLADSTENSNWRGAFDRALPKPANCNELHRAMSDVLTAEETLPETSAAAAEPSVALQPPAILAALRSSLTPALWSGLVAAVEQELSHYTTAIAAAGAAKDDAGVTACARAMGGIAATFAARALAEEAARICTAPARARDSYIIVRVQCLIRDWALGARARGAPDVV